MSAYIVMSPISSLQARIIIIMLLNKYEKFTVFAKDEFAEELLFKIEKNC